MTVISISVILYEINRIFWDTYLNKKGLFLISKINGNYFMI